MYSWLFIFLHLSFVFSHHIPQFSSFCCYSSPLALFVILNFTIWRHWPANSLCIKSINPRIKLLKPEIPLNVNFRTILKTHALFHCNTGKGSNSKLSCSRWLVRSQKSGDNVLVVIHNSVSSFFPHLLEHPHLPEPFRPSCRVHTTTAAVAHQESVSDSHWIHITGSDV